MLQHNALLGSKTRLSKMIQREIYSAYCEPHASNFVMIYLQSL